MCYNAHIQQSRQRFIHKIADWNPRPTASASATQQQIGENWDIIVPGDLFSTLWTVRSWCYNGFIVRDTPDAYMEETPGCCAKKTGAEYEKFIWHVRKVHLLFTLSEY